MTLPPNVTIRPGQYARFNAMGRFMQVETSPSHGLGFLYRAQAEGTLRRVFF